MGALVTYERDGQIASITMDDGKVNVFSIPMLTELHAAFDQAQADQAVVVLSGRENYFSAGFEILSLGATLAERVLSFPTPVVVACTGHAYPAGVFLLLSADLRIGADGPYRIGLNEVRIGMTLPWFAIELARHRLHPTHFDRTVVNATMYSPAEAIVPGFLDRIVEPAELRKVSLEAAADLAELDQRAHAATKLRARGAALAALRNAIEVELKPATT
jgi:enoyl-CoA hydratase